MKALRHTHTHPRPRLHRSGLRERGSEPTPCNSRAPAHPSLCALFDPWVEIQAEPQPYPQLVSAGSLVGPNSHILCAGDEPRHSFANLLHFCPGTTKCVHPLFPSMESEFPAWLASQCFTLPCKLSPLENPSFPTAAGVWL